MIKDQDRYIESYMIYYTGLSAIEAWEIETTAINGILVTDTGELYKIERINYEEQK